MSSAFASAATRAVNVFDVPDAVGASVSSGTHAHTRIAASDAGVNFFRAIGDPPLATVAVVGSAREGKSTLMNALLDTPDVFKIGHGSETCTRGVHASSVMPTWSRFAGAAWTGAGPEPKIVAIDSEGGGCKGGAYDMQIITPTIVLADCVILNWFGRLQPASIADKLGTLSVAAARVTAGLGDAADADAPALGHLHIVFRDYGLELDDPSKLASTAEARVDLEAEPERAGAVVRDWYLALGSQPVRAVKATWRRNRPASHNFSVDLKQEEQMESVRNRVVNGFRSVTVWLMPSAVSSHDKFIGHVCLMRGKIAQQMQHSAASPGIRVVRSTGCKVAALLPQLAVAVNSGAEELPLDSMYQAAMKAECKRVVDQLAAAFASAAAADSATRAVILAANFNTRAATAQADLHSKLAALGVTTSIAGEAAGELRKALLAAGLAELRDRANLLKTAGAAFVSSYLPCIPGIADAALQQLKRTIREDATGTITCDGPTSVRLPLEAAKQHLRTSIAARHADALRAAMGRDAVFCTALRAAPSTAADTASGKPAASGGAPATTTSSAALFSSEHTAQLVFEGASLARAISTVVRQHADRVAATLAAEFTSAKDAYHAKQQAAAAERLRVAEAETAAAKQRAADASAAAARAAEATRAVTPRPVRHNSEERSSEPSFASIVSGLFSVLGSPASRSDTAAAGYSTPPPPAPSHSRGAAASGSFTPEHIKKDGTLDMRFSDNKAAVASGSASRDTVYGSGGSAGGASAWSSVSSPGPLKLDGTLDMRYSASKAAVASGSATRDTVYASGGSTRSAAASSFSSPGPLKQDGTPDMRFRANREYFGLGSS